MPHEDPCWGKVAEVRRGYRLRDKVLRPALVAVAEGGSAGGADTTSNKHTNDDELTN